MEINLEELFNEAYQSSGHHHHHHEHHHHHDNPNIPKFDHHGDWYHDGICTHYNGLEMEDLYLNDKGQRISCGFLLEDEVTGKFLGCHATGQPDCYDIPKGCMGVDDNPKETAIRELWEETGMKLSGSEDIEDLGEFELKDYKRLHLFHVKVPVDLKKLHCESMFKDFHDGKVKPEVDNYVLLDDITKFYRSLQPTLEKVLF